MKKIKPSHIIGPALILLVFAGGSLSAWRRADAQLRDIVSDWAQEQRAQGLSVSYSSLDTNGFPLALRAVIGAPVIEKDGAWHWSADALEVTLDPRDLARISMTPRGSMRLVYAGNEWRVDSARTRFAFEAKGERGWSAHLDAGLVNAICEKCETRLKADRVIVEIAPQAQHSTTYDISLETQEFESVHANGNMLASKFEFRASLSEAFKISGENASLDNWRSAGGTLALHEVSLTASDASVKANGVISIDKSGFPAGWVSVESRGLEGMAALAQEAGVIDAGQVDDLMARIRPLAKVTGDVIAAPLELEAGAIKIGDMELYALPQILPE